MSYDEWVTTDRDWERQQDWYDDADTWMWLPEVQDDPDAEESEA